MDWIIDNNNKEYISQLLNSKLLQPEIPGLETDINATKSRINNKDTTLWQEKRVQKKPGVSENSGIEAYKARYKPQISDKFINSGRLLVKIQDGCQRFCTFCIVPYLRGQPKSRRIAEIVKSINKFTNLENAGGAKEGSQSKLHGLESRPSRDDFEAGIGKPARQDPHIKEVILTAINTQAYGYDTGQSFIDLLNNIIDKTRIPRISFGSIHPWSIDDDFFRFYKSALNHERLVKFFHIPLQSGSNKILSYMKRGYTREEFMEKLKTLEKIHPMTFIGTDIIAGFLEETDRDFEDTYNFLSKTPISKFHVFRFNRREKTAAYFMAKRLSEPTPAQKKKRVKALIELSQRKYQMFLEKHIGLVFPVLLIDKASKGYRQGLLNNQIPVDIKSDKETGDIIEEVRIESVAKGRLRGNTV
ncbi:MAG: radical SAM protein [Patescibacteria group bacterium]|nr:radical SAM protein [Patescibacteria group bacterium]